MVKISQYPRLMHLNKNSLITALSWIDVCSAPLINSCSFIWLLKYRCRKLTLGTRFSHIDLCTMPRTESRPKEPPLPSHPSGLCHLCYTLQEIHSWIRVLNIRKSIYGPNTKKHDLFLTTLCICVKKCSYSINQRKCKLVWIQLHLAMGWTLYYAWNNTRPNALLGFSRKKWVPLFHRITGK